MDCHFLLQGLFPTQGLNLGLLHCRQSVFQSPDTEQTGNGMGTSARLAFPPNSEAGRIQAILQMRSWEVRQIFLLTELQGKPHIEGYTSEQICPFLENFLTLSLKSCTSAVLEPPGPQQVQNAGTRTVSPPTLLGGEALVEVVMGCGVWVGIAIWLCK